MPFPIVGREEDLASVHAFVDRADAGVAALVLEGEAGIGKSTLWLAGVDHARSLGVRVLASRPAEAECGLAHVGLGDLFDTVLDEVLPALSPPRRRALEVALLRQDASPVSADDRALGVAVQDALQLLGERGPIVVAVDDVQWFDVSSSSALAFALRRVGESRVLLLLARRLVDGSKPSTIEQALDDERILRLRVGPLSVGALHRLLHDRLGRSFARQTLLRVHERSGGNPFFALELARTLDADVDPLEPLPVPETLDELVRTRLGGLPPATRAALALASALGTPSESLLEQAGVVADALEPALIAHVIERDNGTIRFTHPLLSSVVYHDLGANRRDVHRRIVEIVDDPLQRARHLALSSEPPNPAIAAVLDEASAVAAERGASAVAAELAEHALRLTSWEAVHEHNRRALAAAQAHRAAGEWTRASTIVSDLLQERGLGRLRAEALILLADLEPLDQAVALLEEALGEAESQPALQARIRCRLAWAVRHTQGFVKGLEHARTALDLAEEVDDDALRIHALAMLTFLGSAVGDADAPAHAARAHELATALGDAELLKMATNALVEILDSHRNVSAARALLECEYHEWHARDETWTANVLGELAWVELWGGRWQAAADHAARALEISVQYGRDVPWVHLPVSVVAAHRGELDVARLHSERSLRLAEQQFGMHTPVHLGILGFVALQSTDPHTAVEWFEEADETTVRYGWRDPSRRWWVAEHVEALLELGRVDDAVRILDAWEADARRLERRWMLAHATRCRGLVAAAQGAVDDAASLLERATEEHERVGDRFGRARALLALGIVRRRERKKRAARDAIEASLTEFEDLGAATWIEKARGELGRIGGRTRTEGLTPAEQRVAALVAEGRTNREVAAALFLGEHTVETHLSHVYAKLGVRSRTELARRFRADEQSSGGLPISS
jgi:DNA-binding CsgD family transcriptional regulator